MSNPLVDLRRAMKKSPPRGELAIYWSVFQALPEPQRLMLAGAMRDIKANGRPLKLAGWHVLLEAVVKVGILAQGGGDALMIASEQVWAEEGELA